MLKKLHIVIKWTENWSWFIYLKIPPYSKIPNVRLRSSHTFTCAQLFRLYLPRITSRLDILSIGLAVDVAGDLALVYLPRKPLCWNHDSSLIWCWRPSNLQIYWLVNCLGIYILEGQDPPKKEKVSILNNVQLLFVLRTWLATLLKIIYRGKVIKLTD